MTIFNTMSKTSSPDPQHNTLFLGDLSCFCQESDISEAFTVFGNIQDIRLMRSKNDGSCLGYGFVTFVSQSHAARALEAMNGEVLVGRKLNVKWASKGISLKNPVPAGDYLHGAEIQFSFVSKQSKYMVTEATIRAIFQEFGEIQDVCIKKTSFNERTGQNGYGFVHYPLTPAGVSAAIQASFIICQLHIEEVLYDCSFTHTFEKFLGNGGFNMLKQQQSSACSPNSKRMTSPPPVDTTSGLSNNNALHNNNHQKNHKTFLLNHSSNNKLMESSSIVIPKNLTKASPLNDTTSSTTPSSFSSY